MKYLLIQGMFLLATASVSAQNMLGISTSRYGGTNRLYINPALAADSPSKLYLNVATGTGHIDNNYVRYQAPFSLLRLITGRVQPQYKNPNGTVQFETDYTRETLNGRPKNGTIWGEVRGPSLLIKSSDRSAFAVTTRFRAVAQVFGASESLLSSLRSSLSDGSLYGIPSRDNKLSANTSTFAEVGLTYAGTLMENDGRKLLLGATAKVLLGYNAQHLINRGLTYQITQNPQNRDDIYLEVTKLDASLAYTNFLDSRKLTPAALFSTQAPGRGFGADVGLTYIEHYDEYSPTLQLGIALTDIGGLTYKGLQYAYTDIGSSPVRFNGNDFNNLNGTSAVIQVIQNKLSTTRTPNSTTFREGLPTSLNLTADYQLPDGLGINLTCLLDARSVQATAIHRPTIVAVTPRYDARWLSLAVPIAYLNGGITAGGSIRVGPAWLGTENFLGLVGSKANGINPRGLDVYGGIAFGIGKVEE